jgi:D-tyrosyl-tRNA(Tyr) deacylase
MRLLIQRVTNASVTVASVDKTETTVDTIARGLLVFVGIEEDDNEEDVSYSASKLCSMRIFSDDKGKMNLDVKQVNGEVLAVSQFTLHASTKKGNRPSFIKAARPEKAIPLYEHFLSETSVLLGKPCQKGKFGADMKVQLVNDGPVTIILDSKNRE